MSEWYENQKKPSSNTRKLLQERIEKANPRRKLTTEDTKRLRKEFGFTAGMLKGSLADGRAKK